MPSWSPSNGYSRRSTPVLLLRVAPYGMEYPLGPFGQLGQLSWLCPLPGSRPPPAHLLERGQREKQSSP